MFTKFKDISFITEHFAGTDVNDDVLIVHTKNRSFEIYFASPAAARKGQHDLMQLVQDDLAKATTESSSDTQFKFNDILDNLTQFAQGAKNSSFDSVLEKAASVFDKKRKVKSEFDLFSTLTSVLTQSVTSNAQEKLSSMLDTLNSTLDEFVKDIQTKVSTEQEQPQAKPEVKPEVKPQSTEDHASNTAKAQTNWSVPGTAPKVQLKRNDVFGAAAVQPAQPKVQKVSIDPEVPLLPDNCYVTIGDLTSPQLRAVISETVDILLSTDKVKAMFDAIRAQFGEDETQEAVQAFKDMLYQLCTDNAESTVSQVLQSFLL